MNILFVLKSINGGGIQVVTSVLANKFVVEGHNVCVFAFFRGEGNTILLYDKRVKILNGNCFECNTENIELLHNFIQENHIEIVINQYGLPLTPINTIIKSTKDLDVKIISFYHNDPLQNGRIQTIDNQLLSTSSFFKKNILKLKRLFFRCVTGYAMRYVYNHSDLYCVLSPSFIENFKKFTWKKHTEKLVVQTNPITIDNRDYVYNLNEKMNEILYVGRLDKTQKCVHRIIEAWAKIEKEYPDWCLKIVGYGEDLERLNILTEKLKLSHVYFEGMQKPRPYYEKAQILLLTSDFEGFGLVIIEGMSFGVVPIVYGSYSAVFDIIDNEHDGLITSSPYNIENTVSCLQKIINDTQLRQQMALEAIKKSEKFSLDRICCQWNNLFDKVKKASNYN
ncbi:MAG: glycosyltransferase [Bacteroidales bacterium]|nr:glycosyltransferase [Bacteroidales bacterium]